MKSFPLHLPFTETFGSVTLHNLVEMERWKMFCAGLQKQDSNQSLEEAIELTDPNYYPNLHAVFRVLFTMPVGIFFCFETPIQNIRHTRFRHELVISYSKYNPPPQSCLDVPKNVTRRISK